MTILSAIAHESSHIAQHLAKQTMTLQSAEHDAALLTVVFGLALADSEFPWPGNTVFKEKQKTNEQKDPNLT